MEFVGGWCSSSRMSDVLCRLQREERKIDSSEARLYGLALGGNLVLLSAADTKKNGKTFVIGLEGIYGKDLKGHQLHTKYRCLGGSCMSPTL